MQPVNDVGEAIREIKLALGAATAVPHDRWLLGCLHSGRLWVLADSLRPKLQPGRRCARLTALARAALADRAPVTVSSVCAPEPDDRLRDWELDWPYLAYIPVGPHRKRPVGLLIVGSRTLRWYDHATIEFLSDLGEVLAPFVRDFAGAGVIRERRAA